MVKGHLESPTDIEKTWPIRPIKQQHPRAVFLGDCIELIMLIPVVSGIRSTFFDMM